MGIKRWSFELLNAQDQKIRDLVGVTGGKAEIVAQSSIGGSAHIKLDQRGQAIDWLNHRVRAVFHDGATSWPVGTYMFTSPTEGHDEFRVTGFDIGLKTKMNVPLEDKTDGRFTVAAGANAVQAAADLLLSTGETRIAVTSSPKTLNGPMTFEEAVPKLEVINKLLEYAGYWSLWCDGSGLFRVEPYVDPASRPIAYDFQHGDESVHFPDWSHTRDMSSVPNKAIVTGQRHGDDPPLRGIATDTDPASPFSYQNRGKGGQGRWIVYSETGVEAESQAVIDQIAERRLADRRDPVSLLRVSHAMLDLEPNQLVAFTPEDGGRRLATVQRMSMAFEPFTDITAEWRGVA